jgi:hypothetical protein
MHEALEKNDKQYTWGPGGRYAWSLVGDLGEESGELPSSSKFCMLLLLFMVDDASVSLLTLYFKINKNSIRQIAWPITHEVQQ